MIAVCLYFQAHQPYRLRSYNYFDVGREHRYFDADGNAALLLRVAEKCYLPATSMMLRLLERHPDFAVSFSISGCLLEQLRTTSPRALEGFRSLAATGRAEFLAETSHHSLAWLVSQDEFARQVALHRELILGELGVEPRVFRNTELIYSDDLARFVEARGYAGILADGVTPLLGGRSPHYVYRAASPGGLPLLLRDSRLSDDIAFRFSNRGWSEYPLTAEKYDAWIGALSGDVVSLFMDFETFGEHQWKETGIFEFFERWVALHLSHAGARFVTPSQAAATLPPREPLSAPRLLSWADEERDVSAWQGNELQRDALHRLFLLESGVAAAGSADLADDFRRLTTSDLYYYMGTKTSSDGEVHAYFSPYDSPYDAYMAFMHVVSDLEVRLSSARPSPASDSPPVGERP
ncbi:MAG: glycoside hydrolase family 57 protein [Acidobacteriota bacterium]|nr:glycoside hydrolase family 57 protein [Acidobacteriota bacterium]